MVATGLDPELVAAHAEFVSASGREDLFEEVQSMLAHTTSFLRDLQPIGLEKVADGGAAEHAVAYYIALRDEQPDGL